MNNAAMSTIRTAGWRQEHIWLALTSSQAISLETLGSVWSCTELKQLGKQAKIMFMGNFGSLDVPGSVNIQITPRSVLIAIGLASSELAVTSEDMNEKWPDRRQGLQELYRYLQIFRQELGF